MAFKLAEAFVELRARGFSGIEGAIGRVTGAFRGLASAAMAASGIAGGLGAAFTTFKSIQLAAEAEQMEVSLETMLGSAAQARKMLAELYDFGAKTPFDFTGLADAAKTMLAFGVDAEKIMPTLSMISNVAAGDANKLSSIALVFGQIASTGRLMGQDLLQLINVGFNPLQQISERTGETMAQLKKRMEQGKIPFAEVEQAFKDATSEGGRFYQMNERQSETLLGRWSTLKDGISQTMILIGKSISEAFDLKGVLQSVGEWIADMTQVFEIFASNWGNTWDAMLLNGKAFFLDLMAYAGEAMSKIADLIKNTLLNAWDYGKAVVKDVTVNSALQTMQDDLTQERDLLMGQLRHRESKARASGMENADIRTVGTPKELAYLDQLNAAIAKIADSLGKSQAEYNRAALDLETQFSQDLAAFGNWQGSDEAKQLRAESAKMISDQAEEFFRKREEQAKADAEAIEAERAAKMGAGGASVNLMGSMAFGAALPVAIAGMAQQVMAQSDRKYGHASQIDAESYVRNMQQSILNDHQRKMEKAAADQLKAALDTLTLLNGGIEIKKMPPVNVGFG